ncbi:MAG: DUF4956 domain-containing protein [Proteobacteria bacterium]|nr:DUF4956 domain-containing protein [Pseudomonadota bacterium]
MSRRSAADSVLWSNVLVRTSLYYALLFIAMYLLRGQTVGGLGTLGGEGMSDFVLMSKKEMMRSTVGSRGPAALPTAIAMASALALTLPIVWIYTLTRKKKGWQQSVVQTLLVLPVIVAGIVVLVKYSLALAFSLGGIVAAVRFRNSLDDTKDAAYILITTGVGLAAAVNPSVAAVLSVGFNLLAVALWYTDFGRAPAAFEGKRAQRALDRALEEASRTGTFVARIDDEVFKGLAPDQLEALADRAWRRRKRNAPELAENEPDAPPRFATLMRLRTDSPDELRALIEPEFDALFKRWRFGDIVHEPDGVDVVEYGVDLAKTVTPGVVSDQLRAAGGTHVLRLEFK